MLCPYDPEVRDPIGSERRRRKDDELQHVLYIWVRIFNKIRRLRARSVLLGSMVTATGYGTFDGIVRSIQSGAWQRYTGLGSIMDAEKLNYFKPVFLNLRGSKVICGAIGAF
jgi:hypothetical protein